MSNPKAGSKTGRRERHLARQAALKEAKALRRKRAAIHRAMTEAERIRKARKKGPGEFDNILYSLGFYPKAQGFDTGRAITGTDVLAKYEAIR